MFVVGDVIQKLRWQFQLSRQLLAFWTEQNSHWSQHFLYLCIRPQKMSYLWNSQAAFTKKLFQHWQKKFIWLETILFSQLNKVIQLSFAFPSILLHLMESRNQISAKKCQQQTDFFEGNFPNQYDTYQWFDEIAWKTWVHFGKIKN